MDRKDTQDQLYSIYLNITEQSRLETIRQLEDLTRGLKGIITNSKDYYEVTTDRNDKVEIYHVGDEIHIDIMDKDSDNAIAVFKIDKAIMTRDMFSEAIRSMEEKNAEQG